MYTRNFRISRKLVAAASAVAITAGLFGAIGSASASEAPAVKVSYADLDLNRADDVRVLYRRLQRAADQVCGEVPQMELARYQLHLRCQRATVESAILQVASPELLAYDRTLNPQAS